MWNVKCEISGHVQNTEAVVQRCSVKKVFLEISQNSQENICTRVSFLIKLQASDPATLLKKRLWHRCFPVSFLKFLRTPFFIKHLWQLLLKHNVTMQTTAEFASNWTANIKASEYPFKQSRIMFKNINVLLSEAAAQKCS